jgi:leader peptidase (prepilin peptidase)/N-methyltransferase
MTERLTLPPGPLWLVVACTLVGVPLGWWLRGQLSTGDYRIDEDETGPLPPAGWLVTVAVPLVWGLLAWRLGGLAGATVLPAFLVYGWAGVALFWIDADVHRLPHGLTWPLGAAVAALLTIAAAWTGDWAALGRAFACGAGGFVVYLVLVVVAAGQFGFGDLVLGTITGLLLGYLGWSLPWLAIVAGFVIGSLIMLVRLALRQITLKTQVAFGPFILLGALWVVLTAG